MKIEAIRKEKEITAEALLRTQFKMESIVYTQDGAYSKKLGKRKREPETFNKYNSDSVATLIEMTKHIKSYYQVSLHAVHFLMHHTHLKYRVGKKLFKNLGARATPDPPSGPLHGVSSRNHQTQTLSLVLE